MSKFMRASKAVAAVFLAFVIVGTYGPNVRREDHNISFGEIRLLGYCSYTLDRHRE